MQRCVVDGLEELFGHCWIQEPDFILPKPGFASFGRTPPPSPPKAGWHNCSAPPGPPRQPQVAAQAVTRAIKKLGKHEKKVKKRRLQNHARNDRGEILNILHTGWHRIGQLLKNPIFAVISLHFPSKMGVYCLMYGVFVLCMGYLSYVWGICLMYGVLVLCVGVLVLWIGVLVLWIGVLVLCMGY